MVSMSNSPDEESTESDVDHGFGDVDALLVVPHEASPSHHPSKGSFHYPSAR